MLLTITNTQSPATDLSYLLHKHPDKLQSFNLSYGQAQVFYPEAEEDRCTAALMLEVDPVRLVRGKNKDNFALSQYVNDRPYVASSFLSNTLSKVFGSALNGKCREKPELVEKELDLEVKIAVVPAKGGESLLTELFEPLGYQVEAEGYLLDKKFTDWGSSRYFTLILRRKTTLQQVLNHLYVLIPVLDNDKHYYVSHAEIEKLMEKGGEWLKGHPKKELITSRYLAGQRGLTRQALGRLVPESNEELETAAQNSEDDLEKKISLHTIRLGLVVEKLKELGARSVVDLGCGEGKLLRLLLQEQTIKRILGMDVSYRSLEFAKKRMHWDHLAPKQLERIELIQGALTYRDERISGFDAAAVVEVIEHLDEPRLEAFERVVFEFAKPRNIVLTTPNSEYNVLFPTLPAGKFRHSDHRFEWTREEFQEWANAVADRHGYSVAYFPVGPVDEKVGPPSQMAVFSK